MKEPLSRIIVFDAVGTLIKPAEDVALTYLQMGQAFGSQLSLDEIRSRFRSSRKTIFDDDTCGEASDSRAWHQWRQLAATVFGEVAEFELLFRKLWDHFALSSSWCVFDDVKPAVDMIVRSGLELAIASNFDSRLPGICRQLGALTEISNVFFSSDIGFAKPSMEFYFRVAKRLGCEPNNLVMVGDDRANDVDAARRAGWTAVHVDRSRMDLPTCLLAAIPYLSFNTSP